VDRKRRPTHLTGDDDYEPTYRWAVIIIMATIVCIAIGAVMALVALRIAQSIT